MGGGSPAGADLFIKKITLEIGFEYREYTPYHLSHNVFSVESPYRYNKPFSPRHLAARYSVLIKDCDKLVVFQDSRSSDTIIGSVVKRIEKNKINKPAVILYE
jgi:hypothetical protein